MMEPRLLQRFTQLIASHTGLQLRGEETDKLRQIIQARMAAQQLIKPEAYHQLLTIDSTASRREWEELVLPLTIGESYFFRDSGQFSLLRQQIIPEVQGDIMGAKEFLKKILYIAPTSVAADLELGALYAKEHDRPRAWKMLKLALQLLKASPPDAVIEPFVDLSASQLLLEVQRRIEQLGHPSHQPH
jgi:hypothetical protein